MAVGQGVIFCLLYAVQLFSSVSAYDTCLAYTDDSGRNHTFRDCSAWGHCCGSCSYRYCCNDILKSFSNIRQDLCNNRNRIIFRRGGLISGMLGSSFFIIMIIVCCICRPGCPLYEMRVGRRDDVTVAVINTYPGDQPTPYQGPQPTAPYPGPPPPQAYPPPGQMSYSQPGFAPGQPAFSPQPQAPPQPSYMGPPPPYPAS